VTALNEILKNSLFLKIFDNVSDGVYCIDRERKILYWNKKGEDVIDYEAEKVLGRRCQDNILKHVDDKGTELCLEKYPLVKAMEKGTVQTEEVFLHHREGYRVPVIVVGIPVVGESGDVVGAIELFREKAEKSFLENEIKQLRRLAFVDELTQVLNRRGLEYYLKMKLSEVERFDRIIGVLFIDVDDFKSINDRFGHHVGDKVLRFVAGTLQKNLRISDLVARYGGDEFVAVVELKEQKEIEEIAERLKNLIAASYIVENDQIVRVTVSIGGVVVKERRDVDEILKRSDELQYESKKKGGNICSLGA
jgi:diguanylate cyclase (GGDEF)-like protein/PAS domain S-box-containing protein